MQDAPNPQSPVPPAVPTKRAHIEHPAAVVNAVDPCYVPKAPEVLAAFEAELYPSNPGDDPASRQFLAQFSHWGPGDLPDEELMTFATMVFPREGIPRLSEICRDHGLVLMKAILNLVNAETKEYVEFDYAAAVADLIDSVPDRGDVYTFMPRKDDQQPLIVCGLHEHELPAEIRTGHECDHCREVRIQQAASTEGRDGKGQS